MKHTFLLNDIVSIASEQVAKKIIPLQRRAINYDVALKTTLKITQHLNFGVSKVLFLTATAQAEANYYLVWQLLKINQQDISKIVILSTDFSRERGFVSNLKGLLLLPPFSIDSGLITELHIPAGKEESDVKYIKHVILQWLIDHQPHEAIFNITGGTKLISIAQDQISNLSSRYYCVYQSRSNNHLIWYNDAYSGKKIQQLVIPEDIGTRLKARGYAKLGGTSVLNISEASRDFVSVIYQCLEEDFDKAQSFISVMNYLCHQKLSQDNPTKDIYSDHSAYPLRVILDANIVERYDDFFKRLSVVQYPFIDYVPKERKLFIRSKYGLKVMSGEWFEVLVAYFIFLNFSKQEKQADVQVGLSFAKNSNGNEIDVAYLHEDGYLNFLECKTVNWSKGGNPTTTVNKNLHKLSSISDIAGLNSHIYFVSLYGISPESMQVAKELNIRVIHGRQILNFTNALIKV